VLIHGAVKLGGKKKSALQGYKLLQGIHNLGVALTHSLHWEVIDKNS